VDKSFLSLVLAPPERKKMQKKNLTRGRNKNERQITNQKKKSNRQIIDEEREYGLR